MRTALHPFRSEELSIPAYIREFGNDRLTSEERARCPICKQRMSVVAPSTPASTGHFSHLRGSGFCPTKCKTAAPYLGLPPRHPDLEAAQRIKISFAENWQKHYSELNWLVKGLHINEFIEVLNMATKEHIWEYAELEEFHIPYILATLKDYPPSKSYKKNGIPTRLHWFRCWFDSTVTRYDDLWIHRESPLLFWRGWYDLPQGKKKPGIEDLVSCYSMAIKKDFLESDRRIPDYVIGKVEKYIKESFLHN